MRFIMKLGVGQFPKHRGMKEFITFDTKRVEDEKHFILECPTYTQIRSQF
jgi:hypothetical protein